MLKMIYFDTDVLVHYIVFQDIEKHKKAEELIKSSIENKEFSISFLTLQELIFVLAKLNVDSETIVKNYNYFKQFSMFNISKESFERAFKISSKTSFKSINDCLHTAIAEKHCKKLITFNASDFKKIQKLSDLQIQYL